MNSPQTLESSEKLPYLYVTGVGGCGSTLLAFLLNSHPQVVTTSEMAFAYLRRNPAFACSCGEPVLNCPFFLGVERRVQAHDAGFSLGNAGLIHRFSSNRYFNILLGRPLRSSLAEVIRDKLASWWPSYRRVLEATNRRVVLFARAALAVSGKSVFLDAQKDPMRARFLQFSPEIRLKVIHLVRDVRGAVASMMKRNSGTTVEEAARIWLRGNKNCHRVRRFVRIEEWLQVTYDELCRSPQETVDRICGLAEIPARTVPADFYGCEHHILGNHMRLRGTGGKVGYDESWKDILSPQDLAIIARIAGDANRFFGHVWP